MNDSVFTINEIKKKQKHLSTRKLWKGASCESVVKAKIKGKLEIGVSNLITVSDH